MADAPASKSQSRTMQLFSLACDGTYAHAARVLENAGLPVDGVPSGHTWRTMGKLSDAGLLAALPAPRLNDQAVPTTKESRAARPSWYQRSKEYAARERGERIDEEDASMDAFARAEARRGQVLGGAPGEGSEEI